MGPACRVYVLFHSLVVFFHTIEWCEDGHTARSTKHSVITLSSPFLRLLCFQEQVKKRNEETIVRFGLIEKIKTLLSSTHRDFFVIVICFVSYY